MTDSNRSSRLLEHVVLQAPDSPAPNNSRIDVAVEMQDIYGNSPPAPPVKKERRRRRKPKPYTVRYYQRYLRKFLLSKEWTIAMIIIIFYVLFVDDIVSMTRAYTYNGLFLGIGISKVVVLGIFIIEFSLQCFSMWREYNYKSLFFWLDIIAIASLIPDLVVLVKGEDGGASINELAIARVGRAARAAGRVARILRVSQFYSCFGWYRKDEEKERSDSEPPVPLEPSRMGNRLINRTTNKVVVIVLVLLFVASFLTTELDATSFVQAGMAELEILHDMGASSIYSNISQRYISSQPNLIYLQIRGDVLHEDEVKMDGIFSAALLKYKSSESEAKASGNVRSEAWFDNRDEAARAGGYNLGILLLVIILLIIGNMLIVRDATKLVIVPMERVLAVLKQLSADNRRNAARLSRAGSGNGGGPSGGGGKVRSRQNSIYTDTSDDMTSNSGFDDDEDEADALFGMLNDIDGNLQAAKERADMEAGENTRLRNRIMDLVAEKKLAEIQLSGIKRRTKFPSSTEGGVSESNGLVDLVDGYVRTNKNMMRVATVSRKVDFGLAIGGRKFLTSVENDTPDIRFTHTTPTTPNPTPPPSPNPSLFREKERSMSDLESSTGGQSGGAVSARTETPQVQAATLDRLVERLTYEEFTDAKFIHVFLLTYRSILSPLDLMERLLVRFCYVTPSVLLPKDSPIEIIDEWRKQKQNPVRIGVYNAVKLWIGRYYWDFHENKELVEMLNEFMGYLLPEMNMDRHAINIETLFKTKTDEDRRERRIPYVVPVPPTTEEVAFMLTEDCELSKYDIVDLAKQITIVEHDLFRAIRPNELLNQAWTKKNKERDSPNILRLIDHFNNISAWIKTQVVKSNKVKERASAVKRAILLGEELVKLNNFNGAMEVLAALSNASISRLKKTWGVLPSSAQESFQEIGQLMSAQSSFKMYREKLHTSSQPCIPYIGVYLSDLVFIDEGNPDTVESTIPSPLINFDKNRQVAAVIVEIQKYQQITYYSNNPNNSDESDEEEDVIERNGEMIQFIKSLKGIDDDTAYKISLDVEPRARAGSGGGSQLSAPSPSIIQRLRNSSPSGSL